MYIDISKPKADKGNCLKKSICVYFFPVKIAMEKVMIYFFY